MAARCSCDDVMSITSGYGFMAARCSCDDMMSITSGYGFMAARCSYLEPAKPNFNCRYVSDGRTSHYL